MHGTVCGRASEKAVFTVTTGSMICTRLRPSGFLPKAMQHFAQECIGALAVVSCFFCRLGFLKQVIIKLLITTQENMPCSAGAEPGGRCDDLREGFCQLACFDM